MGQRAASKEPQRALVLSLGIGGMLLALVLVYIGQTATNGIPLRSYYTVDAAFADADNIAPHAQVRMGGRMVGQVLDPRVEDGEARLTLQLKGDVEPLLDDSRIEIRPRSAIGVRYVEVIPGQRGAPLPEGALIAEDRTSATRPLDEVLGTLDAPTRARTQTLLRNLGLSVAGRGEDLNTALGTAAPFLEDLGGVTGAIADRPQAAGGFVRGAETAASAVDPVRDDFTRGFRPEADVADAFAQEREALHDTLEEAPGALRGVEAGLRATSPLLREVTRFSTVALPLLRAAPGSLRQTDALLDEAGPTLKTAERTLVAAERAVDPTLELLRALRPELEPLRTAFAESTPLVRNLAPRYCDLRNMFGNWSSMMQFGTSIGNYLRFNIPATPESVQGWQGAVDLGRLAGTGNAYPAPCEAGSEQVAGRTR